MEKLYVKLENCYGIGNFEKEFDFSNTNTFLIYAPNGTMKTSFARTFECISKNDKKISPSDRAYPNRKTTYSILSDNQKIDADSIFVVNAEDNSFDATNKISSFIASKELKQKYDLIYFELDKAKGEFIKKLRTSSQSTDCETEFVATFSEEDKVDFFISLLSIVDTLKEKYQKYDFRYNDIFDKKGNVEKFLEKNQSLLQQYFNNYQDLLSKSTFFKKSNNSFGTIQANEIIKSIEDNSFFEAGHKFVLDGDINVDSAENLKEIVDKEINTIINDAKLKETFDKVDKSIGANAELRAFKNTIERNNLLLIELQNYDDFKKKVWLGYLFELKADVISLTELYNAKKTELEKLLKEAKKEVEIWKKIIDLFNSRFYVPFNVKLKNQEDIILKQETANLEFEYVDSKIDAPIIQNKENLLNILSKGEQRAYYILQLLFDVEARKRRSDNLLIFDDIADSFDYKNKYAIIEYIKDLHELGTFKLIILTHNFDFYRTISSRLFLGSSVFMTTKNDNREIKLVNGQYRQDIFPHFTSRISEPKIFISLIPFVRNIIDYSDGKDCSNYKLLTSCLHEKSESVTITNDKVLEIFKLKLNKCNGSTISFGSKNIIDFIFETSQNIINDTNIDEILLENKIVLSIAIRLKAERFMIKALPGLDLENITSNQTRELFKEYKKSGSDFEKVRVLDKVNLMTPENIHMNAFMYEPLIDM